KVIDARRLHTDPPSFADPLEQLIMAAGIVPKLPGLPLVLVLTPALRCQRLRAHVDTHPCLDRLHLHSILRYSRHGLPDPVPSPADLVNAGSRASDTLRHW